jgi:hypothetical protein
MICLLLLIEIVFNDVFSQIIKDTSILKKEAHLILNESFIIRDKQLDLLLEIHNQSNVNCKSPHIQLSSTGVASAILFPPIIKPGASIYYNCVVDPALNYNIMSGLLSGKNRRGRSGIPYNSDENAYYHAGNYRFNYIDCIKRSNLFFVDTICAIDDTARIKEKYVMHPLLDNYYILEDVINTRKSLDEYSDTHFNKELLVEIKSKDKKIEKVSLKDLKIQDKNFYYKTYTAQIHSFGKRPENIDSIENIFACFTLTNTSNQFLFIKSNLNEDPKLNYFLSYFGEDSREGKNTEAITLTPNGILVLSIFLKKSEFKKKYIKIHTNQIFLNCEKGKFKIQFSKGYSLD